MNAIKSVLLDKRGVSELLSTLVGLFVITIMLVISLTFIHVANHQSTLNEFANQMLTVVCDYGKTGGSEIDQRYDTLVDSLQLQPTVHYDATYFADNKVQYGDSIEVTATSSEVISILGMDFTMDFESVKSGRSEQYWK